MTRQCQWALLLAAASYALQTPTPRVVKQRRPHATPVVDTPAADMSDASAAALIAGTTVGAGVLALPAATASAGFAASTGVLCGSWVFMAAAGLLVAEAAAAVAERTGEADVGFLATVRELLGEDVSRVTGATYAFLHYALLVAYAAQGGGLLAGAVGAPAAAGALVFGAGVGGGVAFGPPKIVDKANDAFCAVVAVSFVVLLIVGAPAFDVDRLMATAPDAKAAFGAVPISILSLVYHNVIPTVSRRLGFDRARIAKAVLLGSAFPLVMFICWNALVQGVVDGSSADPVAALIAAESGEAGAELSAAVQIFSFSAVVTSFVGFYYGMRGLVRDTLVESSASGLATDERVLAAAVLVPPSILAATDPTLFLPALDAAERLLQNYDAEVAAHLAALGCTPTDWAWPILRSFLSECLKKQDWLRLWDHVLARPDRAHRLLLAPVALALGYVLKFLAALELLGFPQ